MRGFIDFLREQSVVGLAVGFILGGAVSKVVSAIVTDVVNPLIGLFIGATDGLKAATFMVGTAEIRHGDLIAVLIDFIVIAFVVYFGVRVLGFNRLDKQKAQ
jgi:large conductance mechanosensitive channel